MSATDYAADILHPGDWDPDPDWSDPQQQANKATFDDNMKQFEEGYYVDPDQDWSGPQYQANKATFDDNMKHFKEGYYVEKIMKAIVINVVP